MTSTTRCPSCELDHGPESQCPQNGQRLTDLGNAERFVARHGNNIRFCSGRGWFVWDGRRWDRDTTGAVNRYAYETAKSIYLEANRAGPDQAKALAKWAMQSESASHLAAIVTIAQNIGDVRIETSQLDVDPYLLNVANGTLDLRTTTLHDHNRQDHLTRISPIAYEPDAPRDLWENFISVVMGGDTELADYVKRAVGYSMSGLTNEECLFISYGTGCNGKTTFLETIRHIAGNYGQTAPAELFVSRKPGRATNDLARLPGRRFVSTVETDEGGVLNEALVKQLTGRDTISARFLFREFFDFTPAAKFWLSTNHKPRIRGSDYAIWRRIKLIPFDIRISDEQKDPELRDRLILQSEGILAWAIEGFAEWHKSGLGTAKAVTVETERYRDESDIISTFLRECTEDVEGELVEAKNLYDAYVGWAEENGERPWSGRRFGTAIAERGYDDMKHPKTRRKLVIGLKLRPKSLS